MSGTTPSPAAVVAAHGPLPVEVRQLTKEIRTGFWGRRVRLLDGVSFSVPHGATVGFVGGNGAGKSTTIKHLVGGVRPTLGSVRIFGEDPRDPRVRARFGYMPELPFLPATLTPAEMMRLHGHLCGVPDTRRARDLLELVGLHERADQRVGSMSKGQQTRLTLALALLPSPNLLILDEPMSGLDPAGRILVRRILRDEAAAGRTILFSSHVLADVEALCDQVVVIERGRVVFSGPTSAAVGGEIRSWTLRLQLNGRALPAAARDMRREGDTHVITMDGDDGVAVAALLQSQGVRVLALEPQRASLEERLVTWLGNNT